MSVENIISMLARRWCGLVAWGAPVALREITIAQYNGTGYQGKAWPRQGKILVLTDGRLSRDITTVVHELAHLAAPDDEHHGERWRSLYARAAAEAFRCSADQFDTSLIIGDLDCQVQDAAFSWLKRSGQLATLHAIGVIK